MPYIQPADLIDSTEAELQSALAAEKFAMSLINERPAPAIFWTHAANANVIFQQLERRKNRRER